MKEYPINYPVSLRETPLQNLKRIFARHSERSEESRLAAVIPPSSYLFLLFSLLLFSLLPCTVLAQKQQKRDIQTEVFTEKFTVNPKDILETNTSYTKITFQEWDKNEIEFTTTVTLKQAMEKTIDQVLNGLTITTKQLGKKVTYNSTFNYSDINKRNKLDIEGLEINLLIKIPKDIFLRVTSRYGSVKVPTVLHDFNADILYGSLTGDNLLGNKNIIDIKYGNLNMNKLLGSKNLITLKYSKLNINHADHLSLDVKYCNVSLDEVGALKLDSKYCTLKIGTLKSLELTSGYDKISIQNSIDNLQGEIRYGTLKIGSLKYSFYLDLSYSKVNIDEVLASFTKIVILSNQSNIVLNIPKDQSFEFDYSGRYTGFKDKDVRWNYATFDASGNSLQMSGFYGNNRNSGKSVRISASYGSVSLFGK